MEEITKIESIDQYDQLFGLETLHPLVNVIDFSKATKTVDYYRMILLSVSERRKMWRSQIWTEVL
jgi:hypothetical protein